MTKPEKIKLICEDCGATFLANANLDKLPKICDDCKGFKKHKPKKMPKEQEFDRFRVSNRFLANNARLLNDVKKADRKGFSYGCYKAAERGW